jgi:hypothetical protein
VSPGLQRHHASRALRVAALVVLFTLYGNLKSWWDLVVLGTTAAGSTFAIGAGIALVLAILVGALALDVDLGTLGLAGGSLRGALRLGLVVGGAAGILAAAGILVGAQLAAATGRPLEALTPAATLPWDQLLWRALLLLWVDTVIPEELAYRGALFLAVTGPRPLDVPSAETLGARATVVRLLAVARRPEVLVTSAAFVAWHLVVVQQEGAADAVSLLGKLGAIAVGGLLFGSLRIVGGNLLAPVAGHWLFNVLAMVAARYAVR